MRIEKCIRCGGSHTVKVTHTTDAAGKARIKWTCPTTGKKFNGYAPKKPGCTPTTKPAAKKPRRRTNKPEGTMPRETTTNARQTLRLSIPLATDVHPDMSAAIDVAEGIVDGLSALQGNNANNALKMEAAAAYEKARAKGGKSNGDQLEYDLGKHLAKAIQLVCVHRGITAAQWKAMTPPGLFTGERDYTGGAVVDYFVGTEGESGSLGVFGDLVETGGQAVLEMVMPEGPVGDAIAGAAAPVLADGLKRAVGAR